MKEERTDSPTSNLCYCRWQVQRCVLRDGFSMKEDNIFSSSNMVDWRFDVWWGRTRWARSHYDHGDKSTRQMRRKEKKENKDTFFQGRYETDVLVGRTSSYGPMVSIPNQVENILVSSHQFRVKVHIIGMLVWTDKCVHRVWRKRSHFPRFCWSIHNKYISEPKRY